MKKVVVFGGGSGMSTLLSGLKFFPLDVTAVITVADDGRSTGNLREEFSMPAMGDVRKVISNMSDVDPKIKALLEYRFNTDSDLDGHALGNLILVAMYNLTGSMKESISYLSKLLNVPFKILPISEDNLKLLGEATDGEIIEGEHNITESPKKIKRLFYEKEPKVLKEVIKEIEKADLIILSMGSIFTSVLPNIICKEVLSTIDKSSAKIIYTCNAVTQPGETDGFRVSDHVKLLNKYLEKKKIDAVVASYTKIPKEIVKKYETAEQKDLVPIDEKNIEKLGCKLISGDLLTIKDNMIRHKGLKLTTAIFNYIME